MRYKIIANLLTVILMLTNVLPILASQDEAADSDTALTWDVGDTAGEVPGEYTDTDGDDNFLDRNGLLFTPQPITPLIGWEPVCIYSQSGCPSPAGDLSWTAAPLQFTQQERKYWQRLVTCEL